jgi:hypothetical protein
MVPVEVRVRACRRVRVRVWRMRPRPFIVRAILRRPPGRIGAFIRNTSSHAALNRSSNEPEIGAVDDGLDGSINGPALAVDDAGFGSGTCTTSVDP